MSTRQRSGPAAFFGHRASRPNASHLISIRLPDELMQRLAAVGNDEALSMSDTIRLVLERGLSKKPTANPTRRTKRT
jgi:hypothetical protein